MAFAQPTLVRLEYLTPKGWVEGHHALNLLDPGAYVERLAKKRKFGRAIELDERLQANGRVWEPENLPDPSELRKSDTDIPSLPATPETCPLCNQDHPEPYDGMCLL